MNEEPWPYAWPKEKDDFTLCKKCGTMIKHSEISQNLCNIHYCPACFKRIQDFHAMMREHGPR